MTLHEELHKFFKKHAPEMDPQEHDFLLLRVLMDLLMNQQEVLQKLADQKTALDALGNAIDAMKSAPAPTPAPAPEPDLSAIGAAVDANNQQIANLQTKVTN